MRQAWEALKEEAKNIVPISPCDYRPCMFSLINRFEIYWCIFN